MKKLSLLLIAIFSLLAFNNAKAQSSTCPNPNFPNMYSNSFTYVLSNSCTYTGSYCYNCTFSYGGVNPLNLVLNTFTQSGTCSTTMSFSDIYSEIYSKMTEDFFANICSDVNDIIPPCGSGNYYDFTTYINTCWSKKNVNGNIIYSGCMYPNDNYCITQYYVCKLPNNQLSFSINYKAFSPSTPTCNYGEPVDPAPGQTSACWRIETECD
jgi:hypothetical protein